MRKEESETILRYDAVDERWHAWSNIQKHINDMKKKGWEIVNEKDGGTSLKASSCGVRISNASKPIRKSMSDEQKEEARKRMAKARECKKH